MADSSNLAQTQVIIDTANITPISNATNSTPVADAASSTSIVDATNSTPVVNATDVANSTHVLGSANSTPIVDAAKLTPIPDADNSSPSAVVTPVAIVVPSVEDDDSSTPLDLLVILQQEIELLQKRVHALEENDKLKKPVRKPRAKKEDF